MNELIQKQKEILIKINEELIELKTYVCGPEVSKNVGEAQNEECLLDTMKLNLEKTDYALGVILELKNAIKGENR